MIVRYLEIHVVIIFSTTGHQLVELCTVYLDGGNGEQKVQYMPWSSAKSQTRLSDFTFTFHFQALEKEMATHSSVPA